MNLSCVDLPLKLCFNSTYRGNMVRVNQVKTDEQYQYKAGKPFQNDFTAKVRLNLNDLLKRRQEEKKVDKRTNLAILSGAVAIAVVVLVVLSL